MAVTARRARAACAAGASRRSRSAAPSPRPPARARRSARSRAARAAAVGRLRLVQARHAGEHVVAVETMTCSPFTNASIAAGAVADPPRGRPPTRRRRGGAPRRWRRRSVAAARSRRRSSRMGRQRARASSDRVVATGISPGLGTHLRGSRDRAYRTGSSSLLHCVGAPEKPSWRTRDNDAAIARPGTAADDALDELFSATYEELRRLAASVRRDDPCGDARADGARERGVDQARRLAARSPARRRCTSSASPRAPCGRCSSRRRGGATPRSAAAASRSSRSMRRSTARIGDRATTPRARRRAR